MMLKNIDNMRSWSDTAVRGHFIINKQEVDTINRQIIVNDSLLKAKYELNYLLVLFWPALCAIPGK